VLSVRQLEALGLGEGSVAKGVASGRLHRLHRGVYAVGHTNLSLSGRCLAAVLAGGPGALLSHYSAGWLWGLIATNPIPVHVTGPIRRRHRSEIRIHHSETLIDEDRATENGIPVTSVARTALDLAPLLPRRRLRRLLKRSEELRAFELTAFSSVLERNRGHRGSRPLRRALALYEPPRFTRSDAESRFVELLARAGLPSPVTAFNVAGHELDVYWPDLRFAVELDLFETHGTRESFEQDRLRQEELKLEGVEMTRVTGSRLEREPERVLERISRLLEQRRQQLER
jgi:very-short-patch-repair endonuclease